MTHGTTDTSSSLLFNELVDNAFDFLERAVIEFDTKPKYSVVHFSTAIELILKARLVHEHWSLIVDGNPNLAKFKSGEFKSINYSDIIPKIEGVLGENIPKEAIDSFNRIIRHRNKMVHFFHEADLQIDKERVLNKIALEQSNAWFYLKLLLEKWSFVFAQYDNNQIHLNSKMKKHQVYLEALFHQIKTEIENDKKKGKEFKTCTRCRLEASIKSKISESIFTSHCRVCSFNENSIKISCPNCDSGIELIDNEVPDLTCPICHEDIGMDTIDDQLNTSPADPYDYNDISMNCALRLTSESVVKHHDHFFCTHCLGVEKEMYVCACCGEGQIGGGDLNDSYALGCEFCDGMFSTIDRD